ncbi:MAG: MupA/Atu3671 family FMN-dependent luciferase-like monooxygenase [Pirellulales bacterium]
MDHDLSLSCFLVGSESLLIECGQTLLDKGHAIRGVVSQAPRVADWARQHDIAIFDRLVDAESAMCAEPFDYLLSITHLAIIPARFLSLPRRGAINFHDGPLPHYAGLNTPAWALINGETRYGITWHLMTAEVDRGDILKQVDFDVAPNETALTLNTKCFQAGLESFGEMISELASGRIQPTAQPVDGVRRYFSKTDRPRTCGLIDWSAPADQLERLVRALDFGRYANPLGSVKLLIGIEPFIVTRAAVGSDHCDESPGTVLAVDVASFCVATGEGILTIAGLARLDGEDVEIEEVVRKTGLKVGGRCETFDEKTGQRLTELDKQLCRQEAYWMDRLAKLELPPVPFAATESETGSNSRIELPLSIPTGFVEACGRDGLTAPIAATLCVYLARTGDKTEFDLGLAHAAVANQIAGLPPVYARHVPVHVAVQMEQTFEENLAPLRKAIGSAQQRGTWLRDLVGRRPELTARAELKTTPPFAVAIEQCGAQGDSTHPAAPLTVVVDETNKSCRLVLDASSFASQAGESLKRHLETLLANLSDDRHTPVGEVSLLSAEERQRVLSDWNQTRVPYRTDVCIHELFEEQVEKTPDATAVAFEGLSLSYGELNERAIRLAARLRELGVGPDRLVGVYTDRSLDLMVSVLGVLKAGGAYVPLDPDYPADRLALVIEDARPEVVLTQEHLAPTLPTSTAKVMCIDRDWPQIALGSGENAPSGVRSNHLAYVIYTSGSTGRPKGVMVEHRNVVNFFAGMDQCIPSEPAGSWLAVTSLSFDISVLELFWTLARGFSIVLYLDRSRRGEAAPVRGSKRGMQFGLFMWGNDDAPGRDKYKLMLDGARYFDENGFDSVWTPERHFHAFGGPYPNPAVTGAALAAVTKRLAIRAGSCVAPLHPSIRIAEEWSVVDNLSDGRVGIAFASGWMPNDFVIRPENHKDNKAVMLRQIDEVRRLWRGEKLPFANPMGESVETATLPRPVQPELPVWITTAGNPDTYRQAAAAGANVLTHLLGQSVDEVAEKIRIYREARAENGLDPDGGTVTLMLHTFVGDDDDQVRELVRGPMKKYLGSSVSLVKSFAWAFPAFKRPSGGNGKVEELDLSSLSEEELDAILDHAFERYFETSGLFGTPETCLAMIERLKLIGVDEIACLLDFGVPTETVLESLPKLKRLREMSNPEGGAVSDADEDYSFAAQVRRHGVTHFQCTPSMARMLVADPDSREALRTIDNVMIGGEAFPVDLAEELVRLVPGTVTNMYGPTETTIWSTTHPVREGGPVPIGRPIANTQIYILDKQRQPVPPGVPGDLYIGGDGVVRGYFDRPELTAERFVPDPFRGDGQARMYATGDVARYRDDGVIEYLGRSDHQVKIRGHRIELGEIETILAGHETVRECVVVAREDSPGDVRLVAYLVPEGESADVDTLREHLREKLPPYMVPSHLITLKALPLTPNGKIDRKALPAPDAAQPRSQAAFIAPQSDLESTIARLWQETLSVEKVGITDNFFDIGGHSLLVVSMHRRMRESLPQPVSITDLYRFPTIRALSEYLTTNGNGDVAAQGLQRAETRRAALARRRKNRQH